jgi:flagellar protein FlaJ
MLSLKKLEQAEYEKKQGKKIEKELPYFVTIVGLLAASGLGPYLILKKIRDIELLPIIRTECVKILKKIDMLGIDPLTALNQAKDKPSSKALGEFLGGYVSAIQSGGNVINYLKSKMESAYERYENEEKRSVEKVSAIVHAWLSGQIVVLAVFIMLSAMSSNPIMGGQESSTSDSSSDYYLLIIGPIMSAVFLKIAQNMHHSNINELEFKKILRYAIPSILIPIVLIFSGVLSNAGLNSYALGGGLVAASIWPALKFRKIYALNIDAESATPQILRDITEARKAGIGPEKCVIRACKRNDFRTFNSIANAISNKLEWGIPLSNVFDTLRSEIKNFQVLISFRILFEVITSGGGNVHTLDSLSDTSEKIYNTEKHKRDSLKPYVIVGFMIMAVTAFTTLLVISSFEHIEEQKHIGKAGAEQSKKNNSLMEVVSISVLMQSWLAGLFIGKVTTGAYSGGFMYSIFLIIIAIIAIALIQFSVINIGSILPS